MLIRRTKPSRTFALDDNKSLCSTIVVNACISHSQIKSTSEVSVVNDIVTHQFNYISSHISLDYLFCDSDCLLISVNVFGSLFLCNLSSAISD